MNKKVISTNDSVQVESEGCPFPGGYENITFEQLKLALRAWARKQPSRHREASEEEMLPANEGLYFRRKDGIAVTRSVNAILDSYINSSDLRYYATNLLELADVMEEFEKHLRLVSPPLPRIREEEAAKRPPRKVQVRARPQLP